MHTYILYLSNCRICKFSTARVLRTVLHIFKIMSTLQWAKIGILLIFLTNVRSECQNVGRSDTDNYSDSYNDNYSDRDSDNDKVDCTHMTLKDIISLHRHYSSSLRIMNVTASDTSFLRPGIFHDLNNLKTVYIRNSNISKVIKGIFSPSMNLIDLSISNISTIEEGSFNGLYNLKSLNVSQNSLANVNFFNDGTACYPKMVDLSHNNISDVSGVSACKRLIHVNLSFNAITELRSNQFVELTDLTELNLKGNSINNLGDNCFSHLTRLGILELSDNQITRIPIGSFKDNTALTFLNLSGNKIDYIAHGTFVGLVSLNTIDLSFNKINALQADVFLDISSVRRLFVAHNTLKDVNAKDLVSHLLHLEYVSLDGNNWTCSRLSDAIRNFRSKSITVKLGSSFEVKNLNGIACSGDGSRVDQNRPEESVNAAWEDMKRYFGSDFKQSEFYEFFTRKLPKQFEDSFRNADLFRHVDEDFLNSKFYKYFTEGYINATFFEFLDKKIEAMKTLREDAQLNKNDYEEAIRKTFSEYFSSLKPSSDYLRDIDVEEETNNAALKTLNKLVIALLFVMLLIWITLNVVACKLFKVNARVGFANILSLGRSREEEQHHEVQLL